MCQNTTVVQKKNFFCQQAYKQTDQGEEACDGIEISIEVDKVYQKLYGKTRRRKTRKKKKEKKKNEDSEIQKMVRKIPLLKMKANERPALNEQHSV